MSGEPSSSEGWSLWDIPVLGTVLTTVAGLAGYNFEESQESDLVTERDTREVPSSSCTGGGEEDDEDVDEESENEKDEAASEELTEEQERRRKKNRKKRERLKRKKLEKREQEQQEEANTNVPPKKDRSPHKPSPKDEDDDDGWTSTTKEKKKREPKWYDALPKVSGGNADVYTSIASGAGEHSSDHLLEICDMIGEGNFGRDVLARIVQYTMENGTNYTARVTASKKGSGTANTHIASRYYWIQTLPHKFDGQIKLSHRIIVIYDMHVNPPKSCGTCYAKGYY